MIERKKAWKEQSKASFISLLASLDELFLFEPGWVYGEGGSLRDPSGHGVWRIEG